MPPPPPDRAPLAFPWPVEPVPPPSGWIERAEDLGVAFDPGDVDRLSRYVGLLLGANELVNLTAIRDPAEAWERHILDSLTLLAPISEAPADGSVLDVGSGGGLPGIPLAIVLPSMRFTLMDATAKKAAFLRHAASCLGLENVRVVQARAESAGHDRGERVGLADGTMERRGAHREAYDVVVARAVGRMATLLELTVPFARTPGDGEGSVAPGGVVLLVKGERVDEELSEAKAALHLLHAAHAGTVETPTGRIVVIEKLRKTPRGYPRPDGQPKRLPLGLSGSGSVDP